MLLLYISIFVLSIIAILSLKIITYYLCYRGVIRVFKPLRALGGLFHISMKGNVELDNIYKLLDYPEQEKNK